MTTEELKKKIDGLFFGLHSTNPGDINALPEILNALSDAVAEAPTVAKLQVVDNKDLSELFISGQTPTINDFAEKLGTDVNGLISALKKDITIIADGHYELTAVYKYFSYNQSEIIGAGVIFGAKFLNNLELCMMCALDFKIGGDYEVDYTEA